MKFVLFKKSLETDPAPIYLFDGEEEYFKERGEEMLKEKPNDKRILSMLDNFNNVLDNEYDLDKLRKKVRDVLNESKS